MEESARKELCPLDVGTDLPSRDGSLIPGGGSYVSMAPVLSALSCV
jgi:hypothetical protein